MVKLVDRDHKWATLIGRKFVSFGHIESCTYKCIEAFTDPLVSKHLNNQSLSKRIELLKDLARKISSKVSRECFLKVLNDIKVLSEKRNLIAHNPLVLHVFDLDVNGKPFREKIISSKKSDKQIEFEELTQITNKAEKLSEELHKVMTILREEGFST